MKKNTFRPPEIDMVEKLSAELLVLNYRLEEQSEKLRQSEKAKGEMLANISHDLRAPSTALRCAIDSMLEYPDMPKAEAAMLLGVMDRRMQVLERLLHDLELVSSMDMPDFSLHREPVDAPALLREYFSVQKANRKYESRRLGCEVPDGLVVMIDADFAYLTRVLDNLYSNAFNYSRDEAEITVGCRIAPEAPELEIYVRDTGVGIAPGHLDIVFERSHTVSRSRSPGGPAGHGLGLSIAKSIVEKHGGRIWCESEYGKGSVFFIRLPVCACPII